MRRIVLAIALLLVVAPGLPARAAVTAERVPTRVETIATWDGLRGELQSLVAGWSGENAVSVTDLQTGQTISVNGSRPQIAACTIKIGIIMVVAQDIEAGRYSAAEVDSLVRSMMGPSNTWPARELLGYAGGGDIGVGIQRVNALMRSLGATGSLLAHPPGYPDEDYGYGDASNVLTTDDLNLILIKLYRRQALSPWATDYVLWSLTIAPDWMDQSLGAPLPSDARLYHKIGQLYAPENTWNDAGLVVFSRSGHDYAYAISYLGSYGASWQDAYAHAQNASVAAWRYFDSVYSGAVAPPPPPPESRTFPQTGFTVAHGFLRYWETFGGLQAFGYPISNEFTQNGVTVQYFERARFEWHPGVWPSHFDVLLGRLGVEVAQHGSLLTTTPFLPVQAASDASCTFYPPTGHRLCFGFRAYWQAHGGLALLGYPISEEFVEHGVTVQYFERQRLEYHPENTPPWDVLGGLLGVQLLAVK